MKNFNENPTRVDIKNTTAYVCESCNNNTFVAAFVLRKASRLITGGAKDQVITIPVFICTKCQTLNKELLSEEVKELV